jgi:hypothetical protein
LIEDSLADRVFDTGLSNGGGRQEREAGEYSYDQDKSAHGDLLVQVDDWIRRRSTIREWAGRCKYATFGGLKTYRDNGQLESKRIYKDGMECGEWIEDGETVTYGPCPTDLED